MLVVSIDHHLGNTVLQLPVVAALADHFDAGVDLLLDGRYVDLADALPAGVRVNRTWAYPPQRDAAGRKHKPWGRTALLWRRLRVSRYDAAFDLSGGKWSAAAVRASGARRRVGFADVAWPGCYTTRLPRPPQTTDGPHTVERYAAALAAVGRSGPAETPPLRVPAGGPAALNAAGLGTSGTGPRVLLHPFAGKAWRRWPAERFAAVAHALIDEREAEVVVIGSPADREAGESLAAAVGRGGAVRFASLPIAGLLALFDTADLLISNESGPTHLAALTDLPVVTMFGPTREALWRPLRTAGLTVLRGAVCDPRCHGAGRCVTDRRCLLDLSVDDVQDAAMAALTKARA